VPQPERNHGVEKAAFRSSVFIPPVLSKAVQSRRHLQEARISTVVVSGGPTLMYGCGNDPALDRIAHAKAAIERHLALVFTLQSRHPSTLQDATIKERPDSEGIANYPESSFAASNPLLPYLPFFVYCRLILFRFFRELTST